MATLRLAFAVLMLCFAGCGATGSSGAQIRFALASEAKPLLMLTVRVNAQGPFRFVLDTGASMTVVSPQVAQQTGIVVTEAAEGHGAGGRIDVSLAQLRSLEVGSAVQADLTVAITDLKRLSDVTGTPVDGIVGYNFLKHYLMIVDYQKMTLRLNRHPSK